jgi:hypothetical protein
MLRRTTLWQAAAALFSALNVAGGAYAAALGEPLHAGTHGALALLGALAAWPLAARRSAPNAVDLGPEVDARIAHLERSVDAVAVDVERIGEGQRYMARILTADAPPPAPAAPRSTDAGAPTRTG